MFKQFQQKRVRLSFKLSGMLLLAVILLICSIQATVTAEDGIQAASEAKTAPCKGLKPFNNLGDLLDQFYQNQNSDCLFEMPVGELEKIWDIVILTEERAKPKVYYPLSETEFYNKPYKTEKDAFYVEIVSIGRLNPHESKGPSFNTRIFLIKITREYLDKYGTLDPGDDDRLRDLKPGWVAPSRKLSTFYNDTRSEILIKQKKYL